MALILQKAWQGYQIVFDEWTDPRTNSWFLVAKPYQGLTILGLYLMFVLKWGPKWMKHREPFKLDKVLIVYNALQVLACIHLFVNALRYAWAANYKWICEPVDFSNNETAVKIAELTYMYFILKVVDLLDTIFFVLRKKGNQVSFLHIYHHTGMVLLVWGTITYLPGGHGTLIGVINTFVHIIMYSYYLYTVVNPAAKQSIWWKKHITQLQILQFFWCVVHMLSIVFKPDCAYPRWTAAVFLPQNCFILVLFIDFYIKTYIRKPKVEKQNGYQNNTKNQNGLNGKTTVIKDEDFFNNGTSQIGVTNYKNGIANGNNEITQNGTKKTAHETKTNGRSNRNEAINGKPIVNENDSVSFNGKRLDDKYGKNE